MEEKNDELEIPKWMYVVIVAILIMAFFSLYYVITNLPFITFGIIHTIIAILASYMLWKRDEKKWTYIILIYATVFLIFTWYLSARHGLRLLEVVSGPEDVEETSYLLLAVVAFTTGLPLYIIVAGVTAFAFIWTLVTRKNVMWIAMKWISLILIVVAILGAVIVFFVSAILLYELEANFYFWGIIASFLSGYQFIMSFLGGVVESVTGD